MSGINIGGVVKGGLLAGLIINISETILNVPVLGAQMDAAMAELNVAPVGGAAIAIFVVMGFAVGLLTLWLYAAVRPRLGPGPKTAICVGLIVWTLFALFPSVSLVALGFFPAGLIAVACVWTLVEIPLATVAGAWVYRE